MSAEQFAAELGINAGTLKYWKYKLGEPVPMKKAGNGKLSLLSLVEVHSAPLAQHAGFDIEVRGGRRVHVPAGFDADALKRLLAVLELP